MQKCATVECEQRCSVVILECMDEMLGADSDDRSQTSDQP